jgi:hypothetical protein
MPIGPDRFDLYLVNFVDRLEWICSGPYFVSQYRVVLLGNLGLMQSRQIALNGLEEKADQL